MKRIVAIAMVIACGNRATPPAASTTPLPPSPSKAAALDAATASYERGKALEAGGDFMGAFHAYHVSCDADARSCVAASFLLREGKLQSVAHDQAHAYMIKACGKDFRDPVACAAAGVELLKGIAGPDKREMGAFLVMKACDADVAFGCYNFGVAARDGMGIDRDDKLAYAAIARACANRMPACKECAFGCREQGRALIEGRGVGKDLSRAIAALEKACAAFDQTCFDLAHAHAAGLGVSRDSVRARTLYDRACEADEPAACYNLGGMLTRGEGGARDPVAAKAKFQRACSGGVTKACDTVR